MFKRTRRTYYQIIAGVTGVAASASTALATPATLESALTVDLASNLTYVYAVMGGVMAVAVAMFAYRKVKGAVKFG